MENEESYQEIKNYNFWISLLLIVSVILNFYILFDFAGKDISADIKSIFFKEPDNIAQIVNDCKNLSLENGVSCLNNYVRSIYKYNPTDDDVDLTLEELKERGGDCYDYSKLYAQMAEELGYKSEIIIIPVKEDANHAFVVIYNEEGYCNVDGEHFECGRVT